MQLNKTKRKLLHALGDNARASYKELAKQINSKKTIIAYNTQKLIEDEVIWKFIPVFAINKLGLSGYKIYIKLHGLDKKKKEELINYLVNDPEINWVAETTGAWDLLWSTLSQSPLEFSKKKNEFFEKYGEYVQENTITILEDAMVFNRDYLIDKKIDYRKKFVFGGPSKKEVLTETEKKLMQTIANDGRYQITKIAEKLDLNVKTAMKTVENLEKKQIIQGYTTFLNIEKLELNFFKLCINFSDFSKANYNKFLEFCKLQKNVIHIIKPLGGCDLELEIETKDMESIYEFIEEAKTNYPKIIKKIDIIMIKKEHKLNFLPNKL